MQQEPKFCNWSCYVLKRAAHQCYLETYMTVRIWPWFGCILLAFVDWAFLLLVLNLTVHRRPGLLCAGIRDFFLGEGFFSYWSMVPNLPQLAICVGCEPSVVALFWTLLSVFFLHPGVAVLVCWEVPFSSVEVKARFIVLATLYLLIDEAGDESVAEDTSVLVPLQPCLVAAVSADLCFLVQMCCWGRGG
jgi:hypothetical protein